MSSDVAQLGFAIDTSQAVQARGDFDDLTASAGRLEASKNKVATASKNLAADQKLVGVEAQRAAAQFSNATSVLERHNQVIRSVSQQVSQQDGFSQVLLQRADAMEKLGKQRSALGLFSTGISTGFNDLKKFSETQEYLSKILSASPAQLRAMTAANDNLGESHVTATEGAKQQASNLGLLGTVLGVVALAAGAATAAFKILEESNAKIIAIGNRAEDTRIDATTLVALKQGAIDAGAGADKLSEALTHLTDLSKKTADSAKSFYTALSNIDPALATAFKSAPTQAERLNIIADGLAKARGEVQRYQLAQEAFGTDNDRLIAVFLDGRAAIDGYIERARALGIVIDSEMIRKARDAQQKWDVLVELFKMRVSVAVVELQQHIIDLGEALSNLLGAAFSTASSEAMTFNKAIKDLTFTADLLGKAWEALMDNKMGEGLSLIRQAAGFNETASEQLQRKFAVDGAASGESFWSGFYKQVSDRFKNANADTPLPAFKPRPKLEGDDKATKDALSGYDRLVQATKDRIEELKLEALYASKTAIAVVSLKVAHELERAAVKSGLEVTDELKAKWKALGDQVGEATRAFQLAKIASDIKFERATLFLSDTDVVIAQKLREAFQNDIPAAMASSEAADMRLNAALKQAAQLGGDFASSLSKDLAHGVNAVDAMRSAVGKLGDQLIDMASRDLVKQAIGALGGDGATGAAGAGGMFGTMFGLAGAGALAGPLGALAGLAVGAGLVAFSAGGKAAKAQADAITAWHGMAREFNRLVTELGGMKIGKLQRTIGGSDREKAKTTGLSDNPVMRALTPANDNEAKPSDRHLHAAA